ncbi:MAG: cytochrome c family protein, partial [Candidatus Thiodiazotropha sp. (ex Lucinoma borealis)]|nr:cytochrome c family protein [Candidatus Thiodiazotropha sp. (ex Lucinoma borealis)]
MPPTATQLGADTRLKPYEERILSYKIPAKGTVLVRGELFYNLLWPVLVNKFKHLPEDLVAPESIAIAEVNL